MKIKILTLCDYAADYNGRLSIMGTLNSISAQRFPSVPFSFSLACQFELLAEKAIGDHPVTISFYEKSSGIPVMEKQELRLSVAEKSTPNGRRLVTSLIFRLDNVVFQNSGTYVVHVKTEDDEEDLEFYVD